LVTRNDDESDESKEEDQMVSFITKHLGRFIRKGIRAYKNKTTRKKDSKDAFLNYGKT
ncbi:hypothetical protein Droror1_Dr00020615, partial [Drosera rotundifolia]